MNIFDDKEVSILEYFEQTKNNVIQENDSLSVTIKEGQLDINKIVEYKGKELKKFEFRPTTFKQFIGQEEAKDRLKTIRKKVNKGLKSHFLIDGIKGHDKTTAVELFAKQINAHIIKRIGKQINIDNLVDIIIHGTKFIKDYTILYRAEQELTVLDQTVPDYTIHNRIYDIASI